MVDKTSLFRAKGGVEIIKSDRRSFQNQFKILSCLNKGLEIKTAQSELNKKY